MELNGDLVPIKAWRAATRASARKGLLGESSWGPDQALLLSAAPLIHTIGMRVSLDLIWVRSERIVKISRGVSPGRLQMGLAWRVFELGDGGADLYGMSEGSSIRWWDRAE